MARGYRRGLRIGAALRVSVDVDLLDRRLLPRGTIRFSIAEARHHLAGLAQEKRARPRRHTASLAHDPGAEEPVGGRRLEGDSLDRLEVPEAREGGLVDRARQHPVVA